MATRTDCIFYGNQKVLGVDTREAQRLGLLRPLVRREIEKHFLTFVLSLSLSRTTPCEVSLVVKKSRSSLVLPHGVVLMSCVSMNLPVESGVLVITHNRDF